MIQDIEPQRFNNQYSNRREPEDHDMVLSFSEKMILAKVMDDENRLVFMTYGELKKITGCDRKIGNLVYLFSIDDTAYFMWNGDNRLAAPGYDYRSMYKTRACHPKTAVLAAGICRFGTGPTGSVVPVERELFMMRKRGCSDVRHAAG